MSGYGEGKGVSYNSYLKVRELKELQLCLSDPAHHDEPLFIIIHQTYELWFKLILHELDTVVKILQDTKLDDSKIWQANFYLKRVVAIQRHLVNQIHILETMAPKDFLGFRNHLNPASGFQSSQFREIEFLGGMKDTNMLKYFSHEHAAVIDLQKRFDSESLHDLFFKVMAWAGFKPNMDNETDSEEQKKDKLEQRVQEIKKLYDQAAKYPQIYDLAELLLDFDEGILLWRKHHATVVERIIGFKHGTGGSEGVAYLKSTWTKKCFPELWQVRTYLEI